MNVLWPNIRMFFAFPELTNVVIARYFRYDYFMIRFTLKKAFFDAWDNLLTLVVVNTAFLVYLVGLFLIFTLLPFSGITYYLAQCMAIIITAIFLGAIAGMGAECVHYEKPGLKSFFRNIKTLWKYFLISSLILILLERAFFLAIPYYFISGSLVSIFLGTLLSWSALLLFLCSLYFLPVACQLKLGIKKTIRICLTLLFDNMAFSLFLGGFVLLAVVVSALTATILPGIFGIFIFINTAVKLRLYKYDYIEKHNDAVKVPWGELLEEETTLLGKRTLRGMIFPWKD